MKRSKNIGLGMAFENRTRESILSEHAMKVAQHDHARQNDTLRHYRRTARSDGPLKDFDFVRRKIFGGRAKTRRTAQDPPLAIQLPAKFINKDCA
jgi:hypothetical protein